MLRGWEKLSGGVGTRLGVLEATCGETGWDVTWPAGDQPTADCRRFGFVIPEIAASKYFSGMVNHLDHRCADLSAESSCQPGIVFAEFHVALFYEAPALFGKSYQSDPLVVWMIAAFDQVKANEFVGDFVCCL